MIKLKELNEFKKKAKSAFVAWERADVIAWEVDDVSSWNRAYIALIIKDRTQAEYESAKIKYTAHND